MTKFARLAALGAWGVVGGLGVGFVVFVFWLTWPNGEGIDRTQAWIGWISVGCVILALQAVHLVFGRQLSGIAAGQKYTIEGTWQIGVDA